jgi:hypothetical protein
MFLGHFGVAFGAKRVAPRTSLGSLFLAAQFVDLLWPTLLLLGVETVRIVPGITRVTPLDFESYPISHSLAMGVVWAALVGAAYMAVRRDRTGAFVVAACVLSHWFLDFVVHRPDLPLTPAGDERVGLGLWFSLPATLALELGLFAAGFFVYVRATAARDRFGRIGPWALAAFLVLVYIANVFGPPPPSATAIAWAGQAQWLLVAFAYAIDRHREPVRLRPAG